MRKILHSLHFVLGLLFVLLIQGSIPFLTLPTLGQAVWATGFAQSLANSSFFNVYAHNFGYPTPAPISFGLSAVWPTSIFIRMGIHPADSYTIVFSIWFIASYVSTFLFLRRLGLSISRSINGAILWLTTPATWAHAPYSMLSLGIALLPMYFTSTQMIVDLLSKKYSHKYLHIFSFFFLNTFISVFMDGYTFMMFAVGSIIILTSSSLYSFYRNKLNIISAWIVSTWMVISFGSSYVTYRNYISNMPLPSYPIKFFTDWGADITFFLIPTKNIHWLWDKIGLGLSRSTDLFFGDISVWNTTFILPLVLAIAVLFLIGNIRKQNRLIFIQFSIIAFVSFYLSLGPSLKINLQKQSSQNTSNTSIHSYQFPTGSGIISKYLPGFKTMRASYRWSALTTFSLVIIFSILISNLKTKKFNNFFVVLIFSATILSLLPNLETFVPKYINNRAQYAQIEMDLIEPLHSYLPNDSIVTFLPYRNDFLVNLISAELDIRAHNIGGDKNLLFAKKDWPDSLQETRMGKFDQTSKTTIELLNNNQTNVVVLPTIDTLWASHIWPYPEEYKQQIETVKNQIESSSDFQVTTIDYYLIIKKEL